ncbi:ribosome recycling factor [Guggenheimella bovis]
MRNDIHVQLEKTIDKTIDFMKTELSSVRAGRANPQILDRIRIDYYGTETPLKQLATINCPEARQITVTPFDRSAIAAIEKAILVSDLGLNPSNDGKMIRLNLPVLTEENRKELTKVAKKIGEDTKINVRNARRTANDELKKQEKEGEISEDDRISAEKEVQTITDKGVVEIDKLIEEKISEIMEV